MAEKRGEETREQATPKGRAVTYCLVPDELAPKLHELLRHHFRERPDVEVVVEQRWRERRRRPERRLAKDAGAPPQERRLVKGAGGRRAGERRARLAEAEAPELPRRARRYAEQLSFVQRVEPPSERLEDLDTARVVARFQAGDREVFGTLYSRYFDRVYSYLRVALDDIHEAEDAAQQVFVKALEGLPDYERRRQPFRAWLFTLARNQAIDELRRMGRIELGDVTERLEEASAEEDFEELSALDWIGDSDLQLLIERLPTPQRQVLVLRFLLDLSDRQAAEMLGRTPSNVRQLQARALRFLRDRLTALGREPKPGSRQFQRRRTRPAPVLRSRRFSL